MFKQQISSFEPQQTILNRHVFCGSCPEEQKAWVFVLLFSNNLKPEKYQNPSAFELIIKDFKKN